MQDTTDPDNSEPTLAARTERARTRGNHPPSRLETENFQAYRERIGRDIGAAMLAELDIWATRAELLHDETLAAAETGHGRTGGSSSDTLEALGQAFRTIPLLPPNALDGSPLLQEQENDGALYMASRLWPSVMVANIPQTALGMSNLTTLVENVFHIARTALIVGLAELEKEPGAAGAQELLRCATAVASWCVEHHAAREKGLNRYTFGRPLAHGDEAKKAETRDTTA